MTARSFPWRSGRLRPEKAKNCVRLLAAMPHGRTASRWHDACDSGDGLRAGGKSAPGKHLSVLKWLLSASPYMRTACMRTRPCLMDNGRGGVVQCICWSNVRSRLPPSLRFHCWFQDERYCFPFWGWVTTSKALKTRYLQTTAAWKQPRPSGQFDEGSNQAPKDSKLEPSGHVSWAGSFQARWTGTCWSSDYLQ